MRIALRRLAGHRLSTLMAVTMLAVGIGAAVLMADILDRLLLRPPPGVASPERVTRLYSQSRDTGPISQLITNYATIDALAQATPAELSSVGTYLTEKLTLGTGPEAQQLDVVDYGDNYFDLLGVLPALGTMPSATHHEDAAVISHALWQERFGGARDIIGKPILLSTRVYTIVAVASRGFEGVDADPVDVWLPLEARAPVTIRPDWRTDVDGYYRLPVIARLRDGVDPRAAAARVTLAYETKHPKAAWETQPGVTRRPETIVLGDLLPARAPGTSPTRQVAMWVTAMSVLVMLIACGNAGNLLLVRGLGRSREIAVKTALGASRARLVREILIEAGLVALAAGVAALVVVTTAGTLARKLVLPPVIATVAPIDARLVLLTMVVTMTAALLFGIVPAVRLTTSRRLAFGPASSLAVAGPPSRLLDVFVSLQLALSVPLIVGAGLFSLSLWHARQESFGLESSHLVVVSTNLMEVGKVQDNHVTHCLMQERLTRAPGVAATALVEMVPMTSQVAILFHLPGLDMRNGFIPPFFNGVDPSFFDVVGMRLIDGRTFTVAENTKDGPAAVIVNQALARRFWPHDRALGRCLERLDRKCIPVVGVVSDVAMWADPDRERRENNAPPTVYGPIEQFSDVTSSRAVLVRTTGAPSDVLPTLRRTAQAAGVGLPYVEAWAFDDLFLPMLRPWRLGSTIFVAFGAIALLIACIGLAVITAYGVTQRRRELGIRLVLGAEPVALVRLVLRRSLTSVAIGLAAGIVLAYVGSRSMSSLLFGITPGDSGALVAAFALLVVPSVLAAWLPARSASQVDPAAALRLE